MTKRLLSRPAAEDTLDPDWYGTADRGSFRSDGYWACVELSGAGRLGLGGRRDWLRTTSPTPHDWPEWVNDFDALPTTPSGKVQAAELGATLGGEVPSS